MDYNYDYNTGTGLEGGSSGDYTLLTCEELEVTNTFTLAGVNFPASIPSRLTTVESEVDALQLDVSNKYDKTGGLISGDVNITTHDINSVRRIYLDGSSDYLYYSGGLIYGTLNFNTLNSQVNTNTSNIATNTSNISSIQTNYLNKTTTTTQETNNEIICKKLRIKGSSTGTITDANSGYFYYDGVYSYFGTNGGIGFSMSSNAFNIVPTAGCYLGGYAMIFGGSNTDSLIRGENYGTAINKKSLIIQAGDALTAQEHYIVLNVRDSSRTLYSIMRMDGQNQRIECNRNLFINGSYGIDFSSATGPPITNKKLYSNGTNLYWDGNQVLTGTLNYLPLSGGTLTGTLNMTGQDLNKVRRIYFDGASDYLYYDNAFLGGGLKFGSINFNEMYSAVGVLQGEMLGKLDKIGGTMTGNLYMGAGANIISSDDISCDGLTATETNATASIATTFTLKNTSNYCNLLLNTTARSGEQAFTIQQVSNTDKLFSLCVQPQTSGTSYKGCIGINQEFQIDQTFSISKQVNTSYILGLVNGSYKALCDVDSTGLNIKSSGNYFINSADNGVYCAYYPASTSGSTWYLTTSTATNNIAGFDISNTTRTQLKLQYETGGVARTYTLKNDGTNVINSLSTSGMTYKISRNSGASIIDRYVLNGDHTFYDDTGTQLFKIESSSYKCIVGGASTNLKIWNDGSNGYLGTTTDTLYFQAANTNKVSITNSSHLMSCPRVAIYSDNRDALYIQGFG